MKQDLYRDRHPLLHALEHRPARIGGACTAILVALWVCFMMWGIAYKLDRLAGG